jgi:hypothetical protein
MSRRGRRSSKNIVDIDEGFGDDNLTLTGDRGIYFSYDGQRRQEELLNISHKKRRLEPSSLNDALAQWIPVPDEDFSEDLARNPLPDDASQTQVHGILGKRKEYVSTVRIESVYLEIFIDFLP